MTVGGCLEIQYTGASASCLLEGDATGKTLTSKIGAAGAEAPDAAFGTAGVLDLTNAAVDTLHELAAVIDGYANYTCVITYGDDIPTENVLTSKVQGKGVKGYVLFSIGSVLSAYSLTSWARTKLLLNLNDSEQTQSEYILNAVTARAERIADRLLAARSYTMDLDGNGRLRMLLPAFPIISVSRVNIDSLRLFAPENDLDPDEYAFYAGEGFISLVNTFFTDGIQNVRVAWNGGFSPIPDDLQLAAIECVSWNKKRFTGDAIGIRTIVSPDGINTGMEIAIPLSAQRVFESYRVA